jgi:thioredoxin-like negative regulator of GroEL
MIAPRLKEIDGAMRGQVKVVKLNCNPGTAAKYDIMPIPTVDVVQERRACLGVRSVAPPKQKLGQWISALVSRPQEKSLLCDRGSST